MKDKVIEQSQKFWQSLEKADSKGMREACDPDCWFVHIGMSCGLDEEMEAFDKKLFQPTQIDIHGQEVREWGDTSVCMTDVDYSLLLGGKETTHHFMTTEVYQNRNGEWKTDPVYLYRTGKLILYFPHAEHKGLSKQESYGVREQLKSDDWLCWLQKMNSIRSRAEEVVLHDLIYSL